MKRKRNSDNLETKLKNAIYTQNDFEIFNLTMNGISTRHLTNNELLYISYFYRNLINSKIKDNDLHFIQEIFIRLKNTQLEIYLMKHVRYLLLSSIIEMKQQIAQFLIKLDQNIEDEDFAEFIKDIIQDKDSKLIYFLYKLGIIIYNYGLNYERVRTFQSLIIYEQIKEYIDDNDLNSIKKLFNRLIDSKDYTLIELKQFLQKHFYLVLYAHQNNRTDIYNYLLRYFEHEPVQRPAERPAQAAGNLLQIYNKYYNLTNNNI